MRLSQLKQQTPFAYSYWNTPFLTTLLMGESRLSLGHSWCHDGHGSSDCQNLHTGAQMLNKSKCLHFFNNVLSYSGIWLGVGWGQSIKMPIRGESFFSGIKWSFLFKNPCQGNILLIQNSNYPSGVITLLRGLFSSFTRQFLGTEQSLFVPTVLEGRGFQSLSGGGPDGEEV